MANEKSVFTNIPLEDLVEEISAKVFEKIQAAQKPEKPDDLIKVADISNQIGVTVKTLSKRIDFYGIRKDNVGKYLAIERQYVDKIKKRA